MGRPAGGTVRTGCQACEACVLVEPWDSGDGELREGVSNASTEPKNEQISRYYRSVRRSEHVNCTTGSRRTPLREAAKLLVNIPNGQ